MNVSLQKIKIPGRVSDAGLLTVLTQAGSDFAWFGGQGSRWSIIPLLLTTARWSDLRSLHWPDIHPKHALPFAGGFAGIIPYEMFSPFRDGPDPLLFRAGGALLRENSSGAFFVAAYEAQHLETVRARATELLSLAAKTEAAPPSAISLIPGSTDESYERLVEAALEDIRSGRYYQINMLRYFAALTADPRSLPALLTSRGGPYSCWVRQADHDVISFSPEHFVEVWYGDGGWTVSTSPIKGTAARSQDTGLDAKARDLLLASKKDRAELHMIIDLMRNDLNRICKPSSVIVRDSASLQTFVNVHHLVGRVEGVLADGVNMEAFLSALCPAGSITGAPKIEVMHAIRSYEGRGRGYFMGNAFLLDSGGRFDSSVLIRTVAGTPGKNYEFSAGSGIVMSSDPRSERLEIGAKCNVLTPEEQSRWP